MRKGTVLSLKRLGLSEFIIKNNISVLLAVLLAAGVAAGALAGDKLNGFSEYSLKAVERLTAERTGASFWAIMLGSFVSRAIVLLLVFAAGTSLLGVVLAPAIAVFRCMLYGGFSAMLYSEYSVKGIAFNAVLIIPPEIIFAVALLFAVRESVKLSLSVARLTLPNTPTGDLSSAFRAYCNGYLLICLPVLLSSVADAALFRAFGKALML